jgi:uncharacterized membrane protein HdeD (DUF308 family)
MNMVLARNWWALALRGVLAIVFGALAFAMPVVVLGAVVIFFGAYCLVDGVFSVVAGLRAAQRHERWWPLALEGLVSIVAGILVFLIPAAGVFALVMLVSAWSIVTGVFRIAAAVRLRKQIEGEWLLILNGVLSVAFGIVLMMRPAVGVITLAWLLGIYAVLFGVLLVALAFRVRGHGARATPGRARA